MNEKKSGYNIFSETIKIKRSLPKKCSILQISEKKKRELREVQACTYTNNNILDTKYIFQLKK